MNKLKFLVLPVYFLAFLLLAGCGKQPPEGPEEDFIEKQNALHNGDYFATYPLGNADSCLSRLKAEVPASIQPYGCLSIWYRMPRSNPAVNFRLLELYEKNYPHDTVFAFCQMMRGEFYVELAKFDSARLVLDDAHQRYLQLNRPLDASDATYLLARGHTYQNNFKAALESYFKVLDLLDKTDTAFSHRRAYLYHDIATAYERSDNPQQMFYWLNKMRHSDHSKLEIPWRYKTLIATNLSLYHQKSHPDSSLYWSKKALDIFQEANPSAPLPATLVHRLARAYFITGDCATALPYFLDAYRRNTDKSSAFGYYQYGRTLGECYLCLGQLDSAEILLKKTLASPDTGQLSVVHNMLSEIYEKRGNWQASLAAARESHRLYQITLNAEKLKAIAEVEALYENAQKELRISKLEQEHRAARLKLFIGVLALLLGTGVLAGLYYRQRGRQVILIQQNQLLAQEKELALAREKLKAKALERSQHQLETAQKELDSTERLLVLKNNLIDELKMKLSQQTAETANATFNPAEATAPALISMKILTEDDWSVFRQRFEESFPNYMKQLKTEFPGLTSAETRLFLLIKLEFENKEIAQTLGISPQSVWRSRHRLSKKLGLAETGDLDGFVHQFFEQ
jgi:tetratricopeptide (TPR) repeat protein